MLVSWGRHPSLGASDQGRAVTSALPSPPFPAPDLVLVPVPAPFLLAPKSQQSARREKWAGVLRPEGGLRGDHELAGDGGQRCKRV